MGSVGSGLLDHGWERIKNVYFYSLLALSTHKNVKCYPTMTQALGRAPGSSWRKLAVGGGAMRLWGSSFGRFGVGFRA